MNYLFRPVDIAPLVLFRIVFGLLGFADVTGVWIYYHLYKGYFNPDNFQFNYIGFEWVCSFPEPFMTLFFLVLMGAAIGILLGWKYRMSTFIFAVGFTWTFLMEKSLYLNHGYLYCWISWIMIFLPANRQWSYDALKRPSLQSDVIERWSLWILPFLMGVVYFYGGIAKINHDWLSGSPMDQWLRYRGDMPILGPVWRHELTPLIMSWGGMLLDLSAPFLLLFRQTRKWILGFILFFHLTNTLIFQIGIFPWLSITLSLLYFPPDVFRKWFAILKEKIKILRRLEDWWDRNNPEPVIAPANGKIPPGYPPAVVRTCLVLLAAFHLLVPFRHHYFEGPPAWTEEGHRYSWRMMLRSKRGYGSFTVKNPETGEEIRIEPRDYLTSRQADKMFTHPDMIWQFAQYLEQLWWEKEGVQVEVYADIRTRLNGRKRQQFIDPAVDLAKVEWEPLKESGWIVPLNDE